MKNVIDLSPYLTPVYIRPARRKKRFGSIAAFVESVVTLAIGAMSVLVLLALLLDALLLPHAPSIDVTIAAEIKATTSFFFIFVFLPFAGIFATTNIGDVLHFKL